VYNPEILGHLKPENRHIAWLDHEARRHSEPGTQAIIKEIRAMILGKTEQFVRAMETMRDAANAIEDLRREIHHHY
jgi:hypothetical protein